MDGHAKRTKVYQRVTVRSLSAVAREMGVQLATVQRWCGGADPMPGKPGEYPLAAIFKWWVKAKFPKTNVGRGIIKDAIAAKRPKKMPPVEGTEEVDPDDVDELKATVLRQKIRKDELAYREKINELIPWDHVQHFLELESQLYRSATERLKRDHGDEAAAILEEVIEHIASELDGMFSK